MAPKNNLYQKLNRVHNRINDIGKKIKDEIHTHNINEINGLDSEIDDLKKRIGALETKKTNGRISRRLRSQS